MTKTIAQSQAARSPTELRSETDAVLAERQNESCEWGQFFADPTLVLPPEFEGEEELPPQERPPL